jgi:hypothetical protein
MKILSLLFSLLLGVAVLLFFLQPWDKLESMLGTTGTREAAPATPLSTPESTAAVDAAPQKPPVAAEPPKAPDAKPTLLANEKAEAERSAALQQKAATPVQRETKRYFKVTVRDNATLEAGLPPADKVVIRLEGVTARSPDETCKRETARLGPAARRPAPR